jgi:hypothetical protein
MSIGLNFRIARNPTGIRLNVGERVGDLSYFQKLSPQKPTTTEECALIKTGLRPLVCLRKSAADLCGVTGVTEFVARLS